MNDEVSDLEVFSSIEYEQYLLILDEAAAFYYARDEIVATRQREASLAAAEPVPYRDWYRQYLQSPEWRERAEATKARFGRRCALCNGTGDLEAHHRTYDRVGQEHEATVKCISVVTERPARCLPPCHLGAEKSSISRLVRVQPGELLNYLQPTLFGRMQRRFRLPHFCHDGVLQ